MRRTEIPGSTTAVGLRRTFRNWSVPGMRPSSAMCGRVIWSSTTSTESPTPTRIPSSMPSASVATKVASISPKSRRSIRQSSRAPWTSTRPATATTMIDARIALGR